MRVVLLGAGLMAQAASFDWSRQKDLTDITIADSDLARAEALARRWDDARINAVEWDAAESRARRGCCAARRPR